MTDTPISRVQRRRNKKFNQMLEHAMKLIVQDGFSSLTMRTLAHSLDITPGALYRYFPSKGHIIGALGNQILDTYTSSLQQATAVAKQSYNEMPPKESLKHCVVMSMNSKDFILSLRRHSKNKTHLISPLRIDNSCLCMMSWYQHFMFFVL